MSHKNQKSSTPKSSYLINMAKLNIGLTLSADEERMFTNGNNQNAVLLQEMLEKTGKFNVLKIAQKKEIEKYKSKGFTSLRDALTNKKVDVLLCPVLSLASGYYEMAMENGIKLIDISYGNIYASCVGELHNTELEQYAQLYSTRHTAKTIWTSPHYDTQLQLYQTRHAAQAVRVCPYVWSPRFLKSALQGTSGNPEKWRDYLYSNNANKKSVAVYEPNLNYTKNFICPGYSLKAFAMRHDPALLEKIYIYCLSSSLSMDAVEKFFASLDERLNPKYELRGRHIISEIFSKAGIVLSHHVHNSLNYTTLEALFLGLPIIHNSDHIEAGYRYKGFNVQDAGDQLNRALNSHEDNLGAYTEEANEALWKYSTENPQNVQGYLDLIEEVVHSDS